MSAIHVAVTLFTAAASASVAIANLTRRRFVLDLAHRLDVSESWIPVLGALHVAAALGLVLGLLGVPYVGIAAAAGLVLYFAGAILAHLRAGDRSLGPAAAFLLLAVTALVLSLVTHGASAASD